MVCPKLGDTPTSGYIETENDDQTWVLGDTHTHQPVNGNVYENMMINNIQSNDYHMHIVFAYNFT